MPFPKRSVLEQRSEIKLLGRAQNEVLEQSLSRADEKDDGALAARKDVRVKKVVQGEIFPGGRNFR
jgi:hypothetical protein